MINLLIADDERLERDALQFMATRSGLPLTCLKANNGQEAVDVVAANKIGIAILDIKMPVMDGLEAARIIREISPATVIVFLTAWGSFDFARQAIRLGAEDYLVKPCDQETFVAMLKKCLQKLEQHEKPKKDIQEMMNLFTREFFTSLKYSSIPGETVKAFLRLKGIGVESGCALIVNRESSQAFEVWWRASGALNRVPVCYYNGLDRMIILAFTDEDFSSLLQGFSGDGNCIIGIGERFENTSQIAYSVHTASMAYSDAARTKKKIVRYSESLQKIEHPSSKITVDGILKALSMRDEDEAQRWGHEALDGIVSMFGTEEAACDNLYNLVLVLYHEITGLVKNFDFPHPSRGSMAEMDAYVTDMIETSYDALVSDSKDKYGRAFKQIKQYLEENYWTNISSSEVADRFMISQSYFPKLFKERMGKSFVEYMTQLRMQEAVKLLEKGLSVKEAAYRTGFIDSNYFSRVFKQTFNRSPKCVKENESN